MKYLAVLFAVWLGIMASQSWSSDVEPDEEEAYVPSYLYVDSVEISAHSACLVLDQTRIKVALEKEELKKVLENNKQLLLLKNEKPVVLRAFPEKELKDKILKNYLGRVKGTLEEPNDAPDQNELAYLRNDLVSELGFSLTEIPFEDDPRYYPGYSIIPNSKDPEPLLQRPAISTLREQFKKEIKSAFREKNFDRKEYQKLLNLSFLNEGEIWDLEGFQEYHLKIIE